MMIKEKIKNNKGFALLFVIMLSSIILAIALGISSVALKEASFTTSADSTNDAFMAADTGSECALYFDQLTYDAFGNTGTSNVLMCGGVTLPDAVRTSSNPNGPWTFTLYGPQFSPSGQSCAIVTVTKDPVAKTTTIVSKGYNLDDPNNPETCVSNNTNRVERELDVTY